MGVDVESVVVGGSGGPKAWRRIRPKLVNASAVASASGRSSAADADTHCGHPYWPGWLHRDVGFKRDQVVHGDRHGRGPSSGVSAVVLSVTGVGSTGTTYLTVYPTRESRPEVTQLSLDVGDTVANTLIAKVGTGGKIDVWNHVGRCRSC